jgi:hypothetical protein
VVNASLRWLNYVSGVHLVQVSLLLIGPQGLGDFGPCFPLADKNKQLTLLSRRKLALAARNTHFLHYEIIGAPKKFKNQPRPLLRPRSVNFVKILEIYLVRQFL